MGKYKTLAKNTGLVFIGTIGSKLVNVIMLPLYTHWLTPQEFGSVDSIQTYSMFIIGFVCLCLPDAIFVFPYNATEEKKKEYFSSGAIFSCFTIIASAFVFWGVQYLILRFGQHNVFSDYTWLIYGMMVTSYIQNYCQSFSRSLNKMFSYSMAGIVLTLTTAVYSILLIPNYGVVGYAFALILAQLSASLYSFVTAGCYQYVQLRGNSYTAVKEMLGYSAPLLPNGIMWWLVNGINRPIMEHFLGLAAIGIYAVANKFTGMLFSVLTIFSTAWSNSVLDEFGKPGFDKFYNDYIRMLGILLFFTSFVMIMSSRLLTTVLTSSDYYEAYRYFPPLLAGVIFSGLSGAIGGVFSAVKESRYFFYSSIWGGISSIVALVVLTPLFGLMGTCLSVAISFFCMAISRAEYASKFVKIANMDILIKLTIIFVGMSLCELYIDSKLRYVGHVILFAWGLYYCKKDIQELTYVAVTKLKRN